MATEPIAPRLIPTTDEDGRLGEQWIPERLTEESLSPPVDLVLLFENNLLDSGG